MTTMPLRPDTTASPVQAFLEGVLAALLDDTSGAVADYIPDLASADPDRLGIALATVDGAVYTAGDADVEFSIQSMSKPFTYALAIEDRGFDVVDAHLGVEPTGDAFNSISLEPGTGRPRNPMINAGAIVATALVTGARDARILDLYSRCAGRPLAVHESTFEGERETGHRNRAIGHMLRAVEMLHENPEPVLDAYFRQCAVGVSSRDVALMAATLANGGVQPLTRERVLDPATIRRVLSVMTTCGMYDAAGDWLVGVGLPAKSGVADGVMAVLPGQLGLCVFSPRLDEYGNSVRGVEACRRISTDLGLHSFDVARASHASLRRRFTLTTVPSTRRRPPGERDRLAELGDRCAIYEVQGDLVFSALERVIRQVVLEASELDLAVLDLQRSSTPDAAALRELGALATALDAQGKRLVVVQHGADEPLVEGAQPFRDLDPALEWCEWVLLGVDPEADRAPITLAEHSLTAALTDEQRARLEPLLESRPFRAGDVLVRTGDDAGEVFLLVAGEIAVHSRGRRLATLPPGSGFGETALINGGQRSADIVAERDGELLTLSGADFAEIGRTDPALQAALMRSMLMASHEIVVRLTHQLRALS